jgi:enoyl-CoA hydratase/carnithine racemase
MTKLSDYADRYSNVRITRDDGILSVALHTNGGPYVNSGTGHREIASALQAIADDSDNRVMIFTGTGTAFCVETDRSSMPDNDTAEGWYRITREGKRLFMGMLDIEVPVISVVNGPVTRHSELPLLGDIVLAAESATFQEGTHLPRMVPGDGMHVVWPHLLGDLRARYFLLTGQVIDASEGLRLGIVNEVLPDATVLDRAREIARELLAIPDVTLRYTRVLFTQRIRQLAHDALGYGLALEGLSRMGAPAVKYGSGRTQI